MEQTFMTIHNLTPDANILFASESIIDILGYHPDEVQGKSSFDYFHPDEVPFARSVHSRGVLLDKAAVLHYARVKARNGQWVSCECCFTVVHDVLVACTSIYRRGERSERRAKEAPQIRRLFSSSPRDPRYHMLEHLSPKFKMPPMEREPRAALILNRFTRNLNVMFATNSVASILGLRPDQIKDKSFYRCIQENCLPDAIECLESAKANDSIAYLRFFFRDPGGEDAFDEEEEQHSDEEQPSSNASDSEGGGAQLDGRMDLDSDEERSGEVKEEADLDMADADPSSSASDLPTSQAPDDARRSMTLQARTPSPAPNPPRVRQSREVESIELEAVVSCTSDGLVVVLRKARPPIPAPHPPLLPTPVDFENGLFAAPWGQQPIAPYFPPEALYTFQPPFLPQFMPLRDNIKAAGGPPLDQLMRSIRDVAVFAWALVGINGNLADYGHGVARGEALPPDGLPVWDPTAGGRSYLGPENQAALRWANTDKNGRPTAAAAAAATYGRRYSSEAPTYHASAPMADYTHAPGWPAPPCPPAYKQAHDHRARPTRNIPPPAPSVHGFGGLPQEPWAEAAASPQYHPTYALPITQPGHPDDSMSRHRYRWP